MDFLLAALGEIASEIFYSVAHLLNLDVGIVFVDTTSTYWEMEVEHPAKPAPRTKHPPDHPAKLARRPTCKQAHVLVAKRG